MDMSDEYEDDPKKSRQYKALATLKKEIENIRKDREWCGLLQQSFKNQTLLRDDLITQEGEEISESDVEENEYKQNTLPYDDYKITLAFQTVEVSEARKKSSKKTITVGVCAYRDATNVLVDGAADDKRIFLDDELNESIDEGKTLDIDLLCTSKNSSSGTGTLLLSYVIAKQLSRTSRRHNKYDNVIVECFGYYENKSKKSKNEAKYPVLNIVQALGFETEELKHPPAPATELDAPLKLVSLKKRGQDSIRQVFHNHAINGERLGPLLNLCSVFPRSGLRTCI